MHYLSPRRWVRDHVHHFGGNTNSITIFGESAGGASVEYQVLSPYSKGNVLLNTSCFLLSVIHSFVPSNWLYIGLFHRAIAQSGSTRCPWAHTKSIGAYTRILAEDVNCPTTNSKELLKCLRSKDVKEFLDSKKKMGMIAVRTNHLQTLPRPFIILLWLNGQILRVWDYFRSRLYHASTLNEKSRFSPTLQKDL